MVFEEYLKIGLIQPNLHPESWLRSKGDFHYNMDHVVEEVVWSEIHDGLKAMLSGEDKPNIILIPELHVPISRVGELKNLSMKHNILIIAGVDFRIVNNNHGGPKKIQNNGIITIPNNLWSETPSNRLSSLYFGKTYFTYMEREMFKKINNEEYLEDPEQNMYIFKSKKFGDFGIAICSDIFDIERIMLYQSKIQHLFIIAFNKDLNTYFSLAETFTRLIYCNVVICNTGYYGGTVVETPKDSPHERLIYKYQGQKMLNFNIVSIPVKQLYEAQLIGGRTNGFKASPPGYKKIST